MNTEHLSRKGIQVILHNEMTKPVVLKMYETSNRDWSGLRVCCTQAKMERFMEDVEKYGLDDSNPMFTECELILVR